MIHLIKWAIVKNLALSTLHVIFWAVFFRKVQTEDIIPVRCAAFQPTVHSQRSQAVHVGISALQRKTPRSTAVTLLGVLLVLFGFLPPHPPLVLLKHSTAPRDLHPNPYLNRSVLDWDARSSLVALLHFAACFDYGAASWSSKSQKDVVPIVTHFLYPLIRLTHFTSEVDIKLSQKRQPETLLKYKLSPPGCVKWHYLISKHTSIALIIKLSCLKISKSTSTNSLCY